MLANLQSVLTVQIKLNVSELETLVMIKKNALLILAILQLENAPTFTKFPKNAQLEENAQRILTAKHGLLNKNMMLLASPLFAMLISEPAKQFLMERNAQPLSAKRNVNQPMHVKNQFAHMMSTINLSVNTKEKFVKITTNVLLILVITLKVASLLTTKISQDVKILSAKRKLIALHGLFNKNLKINAKKLFAIFPPTLVNLSY